MTSRMSYSNQLVVALLFTLFSSCLWAAGTFVLSCDPGIPQIRFAADEIRASVGKGTAIKLISIKELKADNPGDFVIACGAEQSQKIATLLAVSAPKSDLPQSWSLRTKKIGDKTVTIILAADANGAMYGGLDLAEALRIGTLNTLKDRDSVPHIANRGIKFNIPLDLRTPSYSDDSDAAQANIPEMWSMDFWKEFIDEMARNRYNVLSLWNLHPFPSIVKVPEFPNVALDDVWRTKYKLTKPLSPMGDNMVLPEMLNDYEVVKKITIDEKIKFWQDVMQYARDRGVDVYWFTWNIFTWGAAGKDGIKDGLKAQTDPTSIAYFRASVRETVLTYPLLAGMGVTAGEQIDDRKDEYSKEKWLWQTYGEGVCDALKKQPDRKFRMIHRYHQTGQGEIMDAWKNYPGPFDYSYKYSVAHMYSMTAPTFIKSILKQLPAGMKTWLTVRNDDIYSFRWGDPDYARDYILAMPPADINAGFYMGPDGYTWGREFLSTEPETPRQLVMKKQWYSFMLWGRLSYDPTISNDHFKQVLAAHFTEVPADQLYQAWAAASQIFPEITRFFWGNIDLKWFPEGCLQRSGFYTVKHFIDGKNMDDSGNMTIRQWQKCVLDNKPMTGKTPLQVAQSLKDYAAKTLELTAQLRPKQGANKELRLTLGDLEAFAHIGNYYAEKTLGACDLALYDATGKEPQKASAINHLEAALEHWKKYAAVYSSQNVQPVLYNRAGIVDIPGKLTDMVKNDIDMAKNWKTSSVAR